MCCVCSHVAVKLSSWGYYMATCALSCLQHFYKLYMSTHQRSGRSNHHFCCLEYLTHWRTRSVGQSSETNISYCFLLTSWPFALVAWSGQNLHLYTWKLLSNKQTTSTWAWHIHGAFRTTLTCQFLNWTDNTWQIITNLAHTILTDCLYYGWFYWTDCIFHFCFCQVV